MIGSNTEDKILNHGWGRMNTDVFEQQRHEEAKGGWAKAKRMEDGGWPAANCSVLRSAYPAAKDFGRGGDLCLKAAVVADEQIARGCFNRVRVDRCALRASTVAWREGFAMDVV
jgi:hypothetical protein